MARLGRVHLLVVYGNVMMYAICYMAQVPVLPYLLKHLGAANNTSYGVLQTVFNAVQFVGGLISGPLMDRYGGRALMVVSFAASIVCYGLTATATNVWMLYISRLPTVLQHAILAARTIVTEMSSDEERARMLGYVGVAYGLGFTIGPAAGGLMSSVSLRFAAWAATIGSALSLAMVLLAIPADAPAVAKKGDGKGPKRESFLAMAGQFRKVASQPGVAHMLAAKLLVGLAFAVFQTMFPVLLQQQYGLDSRGNGLVLSYLGVLFVAVQALLIGPVTRKVDEATAEYFCCCGLFVSFLALSGASRLWHLLALLIPLSAAGQLNSTLNTARLTKAVNPSQRGTVLALDMSLFSGVRMISPALGSWAVGRFGYSAVGAISSLLVGLLLLLVQLRVVRMGRSLEVAPRAEDEGGVAAGGGSSAGGKDKEA